MAAPVAAAVRPAIVPLDGEWQFRTNGDWTTVTVPHTWQVDDRWVEYRGVAWYRREFDAQAEWAAGHVRIEFEAVFHSAWITVNGKPAGEHVGKGYTAFTVDATPHLKFGGANVVEVKVDNSFFDAMLPRGNSSDWAHDGGIYRPARLLVTPKTFIESVAIDALPDASMKRAELKIAVDVRGEAKPWSLAFRVMDDATGDVVLRMKSEGATAAAALENPKLWHFDHPRLYRLETDLLQNGVVTQTVRETFGVRRFEVKNAGFYLNGERVWLMGVERMAGSNPDYGMAEPGAWIRHDHDDMKYLNCVFTRVHWQQDRRVLDYCDRHGMMIQTEVPAWSPDTFKGMTDQPSAAIMNNGLEQLREMIRRDRNHPSIMSWGLCNEIQGQNPPAAEFARRMLKEAKTLDPNRLCSYASNSLQTTPEQDVSAEMDFIEWNEYYESWSAGTPDSVRENLRMIRAAFPGKPIVISEYGYCACTPQRPEDDAKRIAILQAHDKVFREMPEVGGLIFFCYNDYRTHVGDKGTGALKQRVHGVVDLYGARKTSYEVLRVESSPVESIEVSGGPGKFTVTVKTRSKVPCHRLEGYTLRAVAYGAGAIPVERSHAALPALEPGAQATVSAEFQQKGLGSVVFDVVRPTGFSALTRTWKR